MEPGGIFTGFGFGVGLPIRPRRYNRTILEAWPPLAGCIGATRDILPGGRFKIGAGGRPGAHDGPRPDGRIRFWQPPGSTLGSKGPMFHFSRGINCADMRF